MGTVYAGEQPQIGKRVAIKVMKSHVASDPTQVSRFLREARSVNEIHHPGIVDVFAFGTLDDGRPYLVMSLLEGRSLRDELRARGRLPAAEAWSIARALADALAAAHAAGIVHRDLKPDNVLLERAARGVSTHAVRPRLLDFGLAKTNAAPGDMALSATGAPMGTPLYMAPEQWWGKGVEARTDQYALGAMLFEMLSGEPPFPGGTYVQLLQAHLHDPPPTLAAAGAGPLGAAIEALVARLLAKEISARFDSMSEVVAVGDAAFANADTLREIGAVERRAPSAIEEAQTLPSMPMGELDATRTADGAATLTAGVAATLTSNDAASVVAAVNDGAVPQTAAQMAPPVGRFLAAYAAWIVVACAALIGVGYPGERPHDPREWMFIAGFPVFGILLTGTAAMLTVAASAVLRARRGRGGWAAVVLALLTTLQTLFALYAGWAAVTRAIANRAPEDSFAIAHLGAYEVSSNRFIAGAFVSIVFAGLCVLPALVPLDPRRTLSTALGVRAREAIAGAVIVAIVAVVAVVVDAYGAAWIGLVAFAVLAGSALFPVRRMEHAVLDEAARGAAGLVAVLYAASVALARVEGRSGILWASESGRAARAAAVIATSHERATTLVLAGLCIAVVIGVEVVRFARLRRHAPLPRPTPRLLVIAVLALVAIGGDIGHEVRVRSTTSAYADALAPQFALFATLDPPGGDALGPDAPAPHLAPALQIARDAVAVMGQRVARTRALASPAARSSLANALCPALAAGPSSDEAPDLSLLVDARVPATLIASALGTAQDCGATSVELLLRRGAAPRLPVSAPPEAAFVLPTDFVAVRLTLDAHGEALDTGDATRFAERAIAAARRGEPLRVRVGTASP